MCDCLDNFKEEFLKKYPQWKGREIKYIELPQGINFSTGKSFYYLPIYIYVGYKTPKESSLIIKFCPICGEKLDNGE